MGKTTFSGPIRAGNIFDTSGTTLGKDVKNVGSVVLSQTAAITQATALSTNIVIPANSTIVYAEIFVTAAWDGLDTTADIGFTNGGQQMAVGVNLNAVGRDVVNPGASATRVANWMNVGTSDVRLWVNSVNAGVGTGMLVVQYLQAQGTV